MSAQHVIITGGASGIGLATVQRLLGTDASVSVLDASARNIADAKAGIDPGRCQFHEVDVRDEGGVEAAFEDAETVFGPPSGLVNSAGIGRDAPVLETSTEMFRNVVEINLVGSFITSKSAATRMSGGAAIVNIASVSGLRGNFGRVAYGASKGGIVNMTQVMAAELGGRKIRVNAVAPGPIDTPLVEGMHDAQIRGIWQAHVPQARYGSPAEVADVICFLLSDAASYVNGAIVAVDGGFLAAGIMRPAT